MKKSKLKKSHSSGRLLCFFCDWRDYLVKKKQIKKIPFVRPTTMLFLWLKTEGSRIFHRQKFPPHRLFDVPPYRDFVILIIFHGGISRKIKTELGFELHDTRRSDPRRVGWSTGARRVLGNCVRLVVGPARSSRSRKELSLSRSMSCLRRS